VLVLLMLMLMLMLNADGVRRKRCGLRQVRWIRRYEGRIQVRIATISLSMPGVQTVQQSPFHLFHLFHLFQPISSIACSRLAAPAPPIFPRPSPRSILTVRTKYSIRSPLYGRPRKVRREIGIGRKPHHEEASSKLFQSSISRSRQVKLSQATI
jgi:hypothetical protein